MSDIKYILWDIDRTLLDFDVSEKIALKDCYKRFGFGDFTDELLAEYMAINSVYWDRIEKGDISKKEALVVRFVDFFKLHGFDPNLADSFNQEYQKALGEFPVFISGAEETIKALKRKYKQYGASNGTAKAQNRKLEKSGLNQYFEDSFISEEVGFEKPSKEFFDVVFERVGSDNPDEYIIIGDSLSSDIMGGENAGIKTCWFNPKNKKNASDIVPDYEINDLKDVLDIL